MESLPTGTVTFLFTDIEGSTQLAQRYREEWEALRARHNAILQQAVQAHDGHVFQIIGDAFCVAFGTAVDALKAAVAAQRLLQQEAWSPAPIRVRMGIHTGTARTNGGGEQAGDYKGYTALARTQRLMSAGHGGQVLVSQAAEQLLHDELPDELALRDMGEKRLKDLNRPERIFQVVAENLPIDFPPLKTLDLFRHNLPTQMTSFIGREKEVEDLEKRLPETHLLTLVGPGGTGKTRLAIQAAVELLEAFPDGVWLVELAPVRDPLLVARTTALAMGLREEPIRPVVEMLCEYLRGKKMLLVLDNCEHLVEACARMADSILRAAPTVTILSTSRESLGVGGEVTYRVPSMAYPDPAQAPSLTTLGGCEAIQLFIDRASATGSGFAPTEENAPALAQICHRLDGIPLAIELAAAKVRVLSVEQIASRLDDRFRLLTGGSRTALERHQTLRAAVDWSHNLLAPAEQTLFRRLSVFLGGWTLPAAEAVCGEASEAAAVRGDQIMDLLEQLINKSLVVREDVLKESRYHMLETIRQYANEKLSDAGESDALRDRHMAYFVDLAETAEPHLRKSEQIAWLERLDAEHENMRAALTWSMERPDAEAALRLAGDLALFWEMRSYWLEGARWLERALAKQWDEHSSRQKAVRGRVLLGRARLADDLDDMDVLGDSAQLALALCQEAGDAWGTAFARYLVAMWMLRTGSTAGLAELQEQSLHEFRALGDAWGESLALSGKFMRFRMAMDMEAALHCGPGAIERGRDCGDRLRLADSLGMMAMLSMDRAAWEDAEAQLEEADRLMLEIGTASPAGFIWYMQADAHMARGRTEAAREVLQRLVEWCVRVGERNFHCSAKMLLGLIAEKDGDLEAAINYMRQGVQLGREMMISANSAVDLMFLARLEYRLGNCAAAVRHARECLESVETGRINAKVSRLVFSQLAGMLVEKRPAAAARLLAVNEALGQATRFPRHPTFDQPYFERFLAAARARLSEAEFSAAWEAGLKLSLGEGVRFAREALVDMG